MLNFRFSVQAKLLSLAALLLAFLVALGLIAISKLGGVTDQANVTFAKVTTPLAQLGEARALVNEQRALTNNAILEPDAAERAKIEQHIKRNATAIQGYLDRVKPTLVTDTGKRGFAKLLVDDDAYKAVRAKVLAQADDPRVSDVSAYEFNKANVVPAVGLVNADFETLFRSKVAVAKANDDRIAAAHDDARSTVLLLVLAAVALGAGLAIAIARGIRRNLDRVVSCLSGLREVCAAELGIGLRRMAEGDLTYAITPTTPPIGRWSNDEVGDVAQSTNAIRERFVESIGAYNETRAHLGNLVDAVGSAATSVAQGSQHIAETSQETGRAVTEIAHAVGDVAEGAQRQVSTIEEARAAATEVSAVTEDSARTAQSTADAAEEARDIAAAGATAIGQATEAMTAVRDASAQATAAIRALGAKSDQIGGIVDTIGGIAEQTNLLALNAAIEAARAGDQGRGFAVVADEVRKLAEESQHAARSIAALIAEIQADTGKAIEVVESGGRRTSEGAATVEQAREAFRAIGTSVEDVSDRVTQIAAAIEQVAASATTMRDDMAVVSEVAESSSASTQQVSAATQQTSASAQEIADSAQDLARTAEELEQLVGRFQLA